MMATRTPIFYSKPSITQREVAYAEDAARNGWGARCYEYIGRLERAFADHLGVRHAIATSSCTGASHMGLSAIGVGPGDEIILGDINWIAVASPITYVGATPVFVDVLEDSWCLDPAAVERAITPRTKAIIAVHLYGNLAAMDELRAIAKAHNIVLIEDAAEALGSVNHGRRAGSMGRFATFSFHGTKTMTTGEGGMFVTNDDNLCHHVATLANHGRAPGKTAQFFPEMIGFKYKMSNLQAAIGLAQIERIDELVAGKRRVFNAYHERLKDLPLAMNPEPEGTVNGYWMPSIVADPAVAFDRDALLAEFKADQIDGRVFFYPLSMLPMFEGRRENVISYGLYERAVNLPTYHDLTEDEIDRVCAIVRRHVAR